MKLTKNWLTEKGACLDGRKYAKKNLIGLSEVEVVRNLIESKNLKWANWFIVRTMTYKQYVSYAVYAAEQVIDIYEKKHPDNKKPRLAIEAAKKCIDNPSDENKKAAADAAAYAADAAADAAAYADAYAAAAAAADAAAAAAYVDADQAALIVAFCNGISQACDAYLTSLTPVTAPATGS